MNSVEVYELDLGAYAVDRLYPLLSLEEHDRLKQYPDPKHKRRFAIGRTLLRIILGQTLMMDPKSVLIRTGAYGKPATDGIFFNLSHAEDRMIAVFSFKGSVGVDIEKIDNTIWTEELEDFLFSIREKQFFRSISPSQREEVFFSLWTMKEAYLKEKGLGLVADLRSIDTMDKIPHRHWIRIPAAGPFIAHLATSYEASYVHRCNI